MMIIVNGKEIFIQAQLVFGVLNKNCKGWAESICLSVLRVYTVSAVIEFLFQKFVFLLFQ